MTHRIRLAASVGLVLLGALIIIISYQERYSKASVACRLYSYPWAENASMQAPRHSDLIIGISNDVYTLNGTTCLSLSELEKNIGRLQFDRISSKVFLSVNAQSTCDDLFKGGRVCAGLPIAEFWILVRDRGNQIRSFPYYLPLMDGNRRHPWYEAVFSSECSKEQGAGEDSEEERAGDPEHYIVIEIAVTDSGYEINGRFQSLDDARSFLAQTKSRHQNLVVSYHPDPACTIQRLIDAIDVCYSLGIEAYVISMREARAGTAMGSGIDIVGIGTASAPPKAWKGNVAGGADSERRWLLTPESDREYRRDHERGHEK